MLGLDAPESELAASFRVAAAHDLVRGFEYEKGHYVILSDEDIKSVNVEATQSVDIMQFVDLDEIDPMFFDTPYYLEPEKKGRHAYALLREALRDANKVGVARVVIRSREHLAALKPNGEALVLELMHYADEIVDAKSLDFPELKEKVPENEMKVAKMLIDTMTSAFDPDAFHDTYREEVMAMIEARAAGKSVPESPSAPAARSNVVDLMDVLQRSLAATQERRGEAKSATSAPAAKKTSEKKPRRKKSAA